MNIFPGTKVIKNEDEIKKELNYKINPQNINPINNILNWVKLDKKIYSSGVLEKYEDFYLYYTHPIHDYLDKLFFTSYDDLIKFLKDRIDPDRGEGLDLIISSKDYETIIVCNHDGEIYQVK
ncbi:hypothetical protein HOO54_19175 [Bacillus sp. WMMC1349]|uniref:hypothetical protein n=1 Tax=Bacillus sp. WMMC1349 TaxID=2736254 RepID=UPI0015572E96|nr:hypothetical protein [Bacillus sp. WMMC1349]NPC94280.1 hypothetical protein [Bacillus sp. WMMC1349]